MPAAGAHEVHAADSEADRCMAVGVAATRGSCAARWARRIVCQRAAARC